MPRQSHLHFSRDLRRRLTPAEARLWGALRKRSLNGYRFNRQARIGPFTVDFLCRAKSLVIEVDGDTHASDEGLHYDGNRDRFLRSLGYAVFRVENIDVYRNLAGVLDNLLLALDQRPEVFSTEAPLRPSATSPGEAEGG